MFQDIHLHLQDIADPRVGSAIIMRAEEKGVGRFVCNATSPADWDTVEGIALSCKSVTPYFGVHPWFVGPLRTGWDRILLDHLVAFERSGVGEIGLDHRKSRADCAAQEAVFARQLDIAIELSRPVQIHCVDAWGRLVAILRSRPVEKVPFMIHLYSGSTDTLRELLALGARISFSLGIAAGGPQKVREAFEATPLDRLLLETDFPYVPGRRHDTSISSDEYFGRLAAVYEVAASVRGMAAQDLAKAVWDNGTVFVRGAASRQ